MCAIDQMFSLLNVIWKPDTWVWVLNGRLQFAIPRPDTFVCFSNGSRTGWQMYKQVINRTHFWYLNGRAIQLPDTKRLVLDVSSIQIPLVSSLTFKAQSFAEKNYVFFHILSFLQFYLIVLLYLIFNLWVFYAANKLI